MSYSKEIQENILKHLFKNKSDITSLVAEKITQNLELTFSEFHDNINYLIAIGLIFVNQVADPYEYTLTHFGTRYLYPELFIS